MMKTESFDVYLERAVGAFPDVFEVVDKYEVYFSDRTITTSNLTFGPNYNGSCGIMVYCKRLSDSTILSLNLHPKTHRGLGGLLMMDDNPNTLSMESSMVFYGYNIRIANRIAGNAVSYDEVAITRAHTLKQLLADDN